MKRVLTALGTLQVYTRIGTVSLALGVLLLPVAALPNATQTCYAALPAAVNATAAAMGSDVPTELCGTDLGYFGWAILCLALALQAIGFMTCLPMSHTMLANVAYPEIQGKQQQQ